jgi:flavin-dependent dehydrogenase
MAERAYGPNVVHRVRYADFIDSPESTMRSLLNFIEEPYTAKCLEPLGRRINSSNVPDDFVVDDPSTDSALVDQATKLSAELETTTQVSETSPTAADALEAEFRERTKYVAALDNTCEEALRLIRVLKSKAVTETEGAFEHT